MSELQCETQNHEHDKQMKDRELMFTQNPPRHAHFSQVIIIWNR